jgi:hypothetical protein
MADGQEGKGGRIDAMTREQVMRARGYDEATIAGTHASNGANPINGSNGHAVEPAPSVDAGPSRTCGGCGTSLEGRRPETRWCSETCRKRHRTPNPPKHPVPRPETTTGGWDWLLGQPVEIRSVVVVAGGQIYSITKGVP